MTAGSDGAPGSAPSAPARAALSSTAAPRTGQFRADIQGLRAIAVLSVVLYHARLSAPSGGFVGVDIFFVISGYLITGILLKELAGGHYSITGFYERRVRRLFPALFVMLAASFAAGAYLLSPFEYREFAHTAATTVFFASNFDFFRLSGYFDIGANLKPLLHTWSLAVEEQFYIVFPLLLLVIHRTFPRRIGAILAAGAIASLALGVWALGAHPIAAFFLAPPRAFELLIGALLSVPRLAAPLRQPYRDGLSLLGLALIAVSVFGYTDATPFPGFAALVPCGGAALIILAGIGGASLGGRLISSPPFTFFGSISYSLYLWHWPLLVFGRHFALAELNIAQSLSLVLVAIAAATLSWKFVERPILERRTARNLVFALAAGAMAVGAGLSAAIYAAHGLPSRFSPRALALIASADDYNRRRDQCHSLEGVPIPYEKNCVFGAAGAAPDSAVWADSHGAELVVALGERLAPQGRAVMQITASACPPALDYQLADHPFCAAHNKATYDHLTHDDRIRTVVIAMNFARYPPEDWDRVSSGLSRAVQGLSAARKTVVLVYPIPVMDFDAPTALGSLVLRGADPAMWGVTLGAYAAQTGKSVAFLDDLSRRTGALAFKPSETLCTHDLCRAYDPGVGGLYFNNDHLSVTGSRLVLARFPVAAFANRRP